MKMRMQELAERSGLPKTTIHHYAREGLLPPAHKTARNAAQYDASHLERLALITRLRDDDQDAGPLSIPDIRRVLEHVDAGTDLSAAVRLVAEGVEAGAAAPGGWSTLAEFTRAGGLAAEFVEALVAAGLLGGDDDRGFIPADLLVARACRAVCAYRGLDPPDLTPLADLLREVGNYSATLVEVHAVRAGGSSGEPSRIEPVARLDRELAALCDVLLWRVLQA